MLSCLDMSQHKEGNVRVQFALNSEFNTKLFLRDTYFCLDSNIDTRWNACLVWKE